MMADAAAKTIHNNVIEGLMKNVSKSAPKQLSIVSSLIKNPPVHFVKKSQQNKTHKQIVRMPEVTLELQAEKKEKTRQR